jgi:uncharacterized membrane protein YtjA (UPF0391 family)
MPIGKMGTRNADYRFRVTGRSLQFRVVLPAGCMSGTKAYAPRFPGTCGQRPLEAVMANFGLLHYAIVFLVVALVAAAVGFGGVAGVAMEGARLLFWIFIVLFVLSLIASLIRRA